MAKGDLMKLAKQPGGPLHKKKRSSSKKAKLQPAVRHLRYELTTSATPGNETSHYIDLARDLSRINRRLYRQGRDYHVKRVSIVSTDTPNQGNRISFATASGSWVARNAWKRGFQTFQNMNADATVQTSGDVSGTWADFKVYLSNDMKSGDVLQPIDNGGAAYLPGEWTYSIMVSPDGTTSADEFSLHLLGDHSPATGPLWTSVGLIKSYGESRATVVPGPTVPGEASDDPLVNVFDYGTTIDEVIDNLEADNDEPPYDRLSYPGDELNGGKPNIAQDTTIVDGRSTVGGFTALAGLIEIEAKSTNPNDTISLLFELAPGNYRGIKADVI